MTTKQVERTGKDVRTDGVGAVIDPWPRMTDWFEALMPTDFGWRPHFPHSIRVEEFMRDRTFVIRAELPGIDPVKDVDITVVNSMLTIRGRREARQERAHRSEFSYGEFVRTMALPPGADEASIHATYENGILEVGVTIPETTARARRIPIEPAVK